MHALAGVSEGYSMKTLSLLIVATIFFAGSAIAGVGIQKADIAEQPQALTNTSIGLKPPSFSGLLDPERFSIDHSVGMTYSSGSYGGMNQHYLGTITYKVAKPLTVRAQVGVANSLFGTPIGGPGASATQIIIPDVSVLYQPRNNLRIEFRFSRNADPRNRWGQSWGYFGY